MFHIHNTTENNQSILVLQNKENTTSAKISLKEGGRLQELKCNNVFLVKDISNFDYNISYASSVLFPFASRIKDGKYNFSGKNYQLEKNDNNTTALHGFVYNKTFKLVDSTVDKNSCSVTLNYIESNNSTGFPFKYFISLTYTLHKNSLQLKVDVKNIDEHSFPFILGWHPYFFSDDLANSFLNFKSHKKVIFDNNLITKEIVENTQGDVFKLKNKQLDDCFFLQENKVSFSTPKYNLEITSSSNETFLQLYTPKDLPIIAIEPMTGISNSFNNKIGLQTLEPNQSHSVSWKLAVNIK